MKLLLAALTVLPAMARLAQPAGFGTVIEHSQDDLCLWIEKGHAKILELRECPTATEISNDQYSEEYKWHFNLGRLYNYDSSRCLEEDGSHDFQKVECYSYDNQDVVNQVFGFIPAIGAGHKMLILHYKSGLCMEKGGKISDKRYQVDAVECNSENEQRFKIPDYDPDNNHLYDFTVF